MPLPTDITNPAPVIIFVYNRPDHFKKAVASLLQNKEASATDLVVYSDAAKNPDAEPLVKKVRAVAASITGFRSVTVVERDTNLGLAVSVIRGVSEQLSKHETVIVLEDDMVVSPHFLRFMNAHLLLYAQDEQVASIHGYCYPINGLPDLFFIRGADCWGWATWKRAWQQFEADGQQLLDEIQQKKLRFRFNLLGSYNYTGMLKRQIMGKNDSWAIRWHASMFLLNKLTLYPGKSLVENIGNDGSGTHFTSNDDSFKIVFEVNEPPLLKIPIRVSAKATRAFARFFYERKLARIISRIFRLK